MKDITLEAKLTLHAEVAMAVKDAKQYLVWSEIRDIVENAVDLVEDRYPS